MSGVPEFGQVWRKDPRHTLVWRDWGSDSVVFDERTGQTHQFSPLAAAAMAWFEEPQAGTGHELARALAADMNTGVDIELLACTAALLSQFRTLGWIEVLASAEA